MLKVGITGGIGSGKSMVCRMLRSMDIPIFESDKVGRALLLETSVRDRVVQEFGESILLDGQIVRPRLAKIVFSADGALKKLESIIHPAVRERFLIWSEQHVDVPFVAQEAAVMIESGGHKFVDRLLVVEAPVEVRVQRVCNRDDVAAEQVRQRISAQLSDYERRQYADYVINNDGVSLLTPQVVALYEKLKKHASCASS